MHKIKTYYQKASLAWVGLAEQAESRIGSESRIEESDPRGASRPFEAYDPSQVDSCIPRSSCQMVLYEHLSTYQYNF